VSQTRVRTGSISRLRQGPGPAPRVTIVSGSVGAGHDGVARELALRLSADGVEVTVLDHLAFLPRFAQHVLRGGYTATVTRVPALFEWIFQRLEDSRLMLGAADVLCRVAVERARTPSRAATISCACTASRCSTTSAGLDADGPDSSWARNRSARTSTSAVSRPSGQYQLATNRRPRQTNACT